ncbi:MAG: hypothetical protein NDI61_08385, partial [Bdellovibrionaceae bacterium]|nr:hypothetical protein [Pseudobdellovibrionaceae bacterium]
MNTKSASRMKRQAFVWALAAVMMTTGTPPQALAQSSPQTKPAEKSEAKPAPAPTSPAAAPPAPAPQTSAAKATTKPAPDVVTKVKLWVQEKWRQFRGMVPGTVAQRPVARPAAPAANAPAPALTGTVSGAKTQPPGAASVPAPAVRSPAQAAAQPSAQLATPSTPALTNLPKSSTGVSVYDIRDTEKIPRLDIDDEVKFTAERYGLGKDVAKVFERMVAHQKVTPPLLTAKEMALLTKVAKASAATSKLKGIVTQAKGKVSRDDFDKLVLKLLPEKPFDLKKYVALTPEELRFLSGLLLYQQGDKCPVAIGLFHSLAKTPKYAAEGSFYLAMCSKKIGLTTDFTDRARRVLESGDVYYSRKILPEVSPDLPYEFIEAFGKALQKAAAANPEIMKFDKPLTAGNIHYILANYGAQTGQF